MPLILSDENVVSVKYNNKTIIFLGLHKLENKKAIRSFDIYPKWNYNVYKDTKEEEDELNLIRRLEILEQKCEETNMTYKEEQNILDKIRKPLSNLNRNDLLMELLLKHINFALHSKDADGKDIIIIEEMPRYKGLENLCNYFNDYTNKTRCLFFKDRNKDFYDEIIETKKEFDKNFDKNTDINCKANNERIDYTNIDDGYSFI